MEDNQQARQADSNLQQTTILVVDDFDEYRETVRMFLEGAGFRVVEAGDGQQAMEVARASRPAMILMDIGLPNFGGVAAIRDIRRDRDLRDCPIIAVTAYSTIGIHQEALAAGCNEVMEKPVPFDQLQAAIERYTNHQGTEKEQ